MQQWVLASSNAGKIREFSSLFAPLDITILPQAEFQLDSVEETGLTFIENAILKARHASAATGLPALADDSGIEVDALKGEPGIFSARYAGIEASAKDNRHKLLMKLKEVPTAERTARFYCVIVLMRHALDPTPIIGQGSWCGEILREEQGEGGFGYDSIFFDPTFQCSAAQMSASQKNQVSHRGKALNEFLQAAKTLL